MEISKWRDLCQQKGVNKDRFLREHPQSLIPFEERRNFKEFDCYSPNPGNLKKGDWSK